MKKRLLHRMIPLLLLFLLFLVPLSRASAELGLETYDSGFFMIDKPEGWQVSTAGVGTTLTLWMRDPEDPLRQAFFFGSVGPFYLSQQQKMIDYNYMMMGGYPIQHFEMPVVAPAKITTFLQQWNTIANTRIAQNFMPERPVFPNLTIISAQPISSAFGGNSELVRALFVQDGRVGEGLFTATIVQATPYMGGPGGHTGRALMFSGITAPHNEFRQVSTSLIRSLGSFYLNDEYVAAYVRATQDQYAGIMRAGQTLRESSEIVTRGWEARNRTYDIISVKRSDAILGKERVYDPDTGLVYEVPLGYYHKYNINRNSFTMSNLQQLPDNSWEAWTKETLNGQTHIH
jgi:hypothetical protein